MTIQEIEREMVKSGKSSSPDILNEIQLSDRFGGILLSQHGLVVSELFQQVGTHPAALGCLLDDLLHAEVFQDIQDVVECVLVQDCGQHLHQYNCVSNKDNNILIYFVVNRLEMVMCV